MRWCPITSLVLVVSALGGLEACDKPPVAWNDPVSVSGSAGIAELVIDSSNGAHFVAGPRAPQTLPAAAGMCRASVRTASGTAHLYSVWWNVRPDSSAVLYSA